MQPGAVWSFRCIRLPYYAVRIVYGKRHETAECPSVRLPLCPVDRQQQRLPADLLLRSGACRRYRTIAAAAAARHAGRVNSGPTVRRSNVLVSVGVLQKLAWTVVLCRRYVEIESGSTKKLYITKIVRDDAGSYACSATIGGQPQRKTVVLHVFS